MPEIKPRLVTQCPYCPAEGSLFMREMSINLMRLTEDGVKTKAISAIETFCAKCGKTINVTPAEFTKTNL